MRVLISQLTALLLLTTLFICAGPISAAGTAVSAQPPQPRISTLKRLGYFLQSENREVRMEFATIALEKMIAAYESELEQLNTPGRFSLKETNKRFRWSKAVSQYLDYLYAFDEVIKQAPMVEIIADQPGPVQLLSGEFLLPISSPRIAKPEQLETDIVRAFCDSYACEVQAFEEPVEVTPKPAPRSGWSFRAGFGSTYQTVDGLNFMFSDVRQKNIKEQISLRITQQLRLLSEALVRATQRGQAIDWKFLKIKNQAKGDDQRLALSTGSPVVRIALPDLALSEGVLEIAKPWLKARLEGQQIEQFFPGADLLFARLIQARR